MRFRFSSLLSAALPALGVNRLGLTEAVQQPPAPAKQLAAPSPTSAPSPVTSPSSSVVSGPTSIGELFGETGQFLYRGVFRFNVITPVNLVNRRELLRVIAEASPEQVMAMSFLARQNAFTILKQEGQRYKGLAIRKSDSEHGKKGSPLPKLEFPTPVEAVAYRQLLERAMVNLARATKTPAGAIR